MLKRMIPSSGELLPVVGLGTWQTFDVSAGSEQSHLTEVLDDMRRNEGTLIDTSPMYGRAESTVGRLTSTRPDQNEFFYATKVWTTGKDAGIQQMHSSMEKMERERMDLIQIHNLLDWRTHLATLNTWKESGKLRYTGITHYTDSMHEELENVFTAEKIDFVQFNYSILSRNAEKRLLAAAADKGVATLINRPFGEGNLFNRTHGKPLPEWCKELNINTWSQYFLAYLIAQPEVNCVIPATRNPEHARDNFTVDTENLPDEATRRKMVEYLKGL
ncbi:MAG: aldo/keto reductase [Bacteroidota bacterium]